MDQKAIKLHIQQAKEIRLAVAGQHDTEYLTITKAQARRIMKSEAGFQLDSASIGSGILYIEQSR